MEISPKIKIDITSCTPGGCGWVCYCGLSVRHCAQKVDDDERGEGEDVQGKRVLKYVKISG